MERFAYIRKYFAGELGLKKYHGGELNFRSVESAPPWKIDAARYYENHLPKFDKLRRARRLMEWTYMSSAFCNAIPLNETARMSLFASRKRGWAG